MKYVEMYGDQRSIVEAQAKALRNSGYEDLARSLDALCLAYDKAEYETGSVKTSNDYDRGYADGERDTLRSWVQSNRQEDA